MFYNVLSLIIDFELFDIRIFIIKTVILTKKILNNFLPSIVNHIRKLENCTTPMILYLKYCDVQIFLIDF